MQTLSVWITLAFTVDRYLFICHPYYGRQFCTRPRAFIVLGCLFLLAAIYSIPQYLERTYIIVDILNTKQAFQSYTALGKNKYFIYIYHLFIYCTFVFFIPISLIIILNAFLVNDIIKSNKRHHELNLFSQPARVEQAAESTPEQRESQTSAIRTDKGGRSSGDCCCLVLKPFKQLSAAIFPCFRRQVNTGNTSVAEAIDMETTQPLDPSSRVDELKTPSSSCVKKDSRGLSFSIRRLMTKQTRGSDAAKGSISNGNHSVMSNDVGVMLIGLIAVFLVCQLPSSILRLITFKNLSIFFQPIYASSLDVSNFLIVTNSTLNCLLYVMLGKKFRREFLKTFLPKCYPEPNTNMNNRIP
jgi:hypothetical protein